MTKSFLISVFLGDAKLSQPDDYIRRELEQFASALMEFHVKGEKPAVTCQPALTKDQLRELMAISASEKDVDEILRGNIAAFERGDKVHDRASARWEFADRVLKANER